MLMDPLGFREMLLFLTMMIILSSKIHGQINDRPYFSLIRNQIISGVLVIFMELVQN